MKKRYLGLRAGTNPPRVEARKLRFKSQGFEEE